MRTWLLLFCLLISTAQARLGETKNECEARYGIATVNKDASLQFHFKGIFVLVTLDPATLKCDYIQFQKPQEAAFTKDEMAILLESNGSNWIEEGVTWRDDSGRQAFHQYHRVLGIFTKEGFARHAERLNQETKEKLKGF